MTDEQIIALANNLSDFVELQAPEGGEWWEFSSEIWRDTPFERFIRNL